MRRRVRCLLAVSALALGAAACGDDSGSTAAPPTSKAPRTTEARRPSTTVTTSTEKERPSAPQADPAPVEPPATTTTEPEPDPGYDRPDWLGSRPLPLRPDGLGEIQPTPPELVDRQLATPDHLPRPPSKEFAASIEPVPDEVAARSTWEAACPVTLDELRYVRVAFWGFDGLHHTGELLVHRDVAEQIVQVFARLHDARFPVEEMRITRRDELDAHPTGDGNNTGSFVCRPTVGSSSWSQHAYGLALDLNPFHNPLDRDDIVIPELASAYLDRTDVRPGMILAGDAVTQAFAEIGWGWGGDWSSSKDWMHFSQSGT